MTTAKDIELQGIDIIFEITRFCNMACPHCIRGDAQRVRIKRDYINSVLGQLPEYIGTVSLTGGEPALAIDLIDYVREACQQFGIEVANFWMATNGTVASPKFFNAIEKWVNYCSDNEISGLRVSIDDYHDDIVNRYAFEEWKEYNNIPIYLEFQGAPESTYLIGEGRAEYNYNTSRRVQHSIHLYDERIDGYLYVNAKGYILSTCDISYETSDRKGSEFVICHCTEDIPEKLAEFFNRHPELVD
jgi:organic radical activating enzyme